MVDTYEFILNKYSITRRRRHIIEIPNMGRDHLAELFFELNFTKGAEIGVERGEYAEKLLTVNPKLKLYCIDPWVPNVYEKGIEGIDYTKKHFNICFNEAKKRLSQYNCQIIRKQSLNAAKGFSDNSLDFVYIDGNHDFVNVTNDIHAWQKKVRPGGIISGHDYAFFSKRKHNHVKHVVLAYTKAYGIIPFFVAGASEAKEGVIRDKFRSWFWVKQ